MCNRHVQQQSSCIILNFPLREGILTHTAKSLVILVSCICVCFTFCLSQFDLKSIEVRLQAETAKTVFANHYKSINAICTRKPIDLVLIEQQSVGKRSLHLMDTVNAK
jgi:hypothetical protein